MNEHVNATAIFADECNVERLKAILRCAKEGMVRAEAAQELGIHYTALAHVIQILEIPFTSDRRGQSRGASTGRMQPRASGASKA